VRREALGEHQLSVESCENRQHETRVWLQTRMEAEARKLNLLRDRIIQAMVAYKEEFKLDTAEVDASIEAVFEYRKMLDKLQADDLPRFEARFKELLNENTIREVANFNAQLAMWRETIRERIARINTSLTQIDYNPGRYIALEAQPTPDADIRDFQSELRACTEGSLTGSDDAQYSEAKFLQVRQIIERLRGREGALRTGSPVDSQGHRRALLVRLRRQRALARGPQRARALLRFGRQVGRPEGEARLHHPRREPGLPVRSRVGRRAVALVPLRRHRRSLRARLGRIGAIRPAAVRTAQPATADRHAIAEDPHHRTLRLQCRLRT
jgi:hypothetical protein